MGKKNRRRKNKAFNRFEKNGHHQYVEEFPPPKIGKSIHSGMIKCKLVHGMGYSQCIAGTSNQISFTDITMPAKLFVA